MPANYPASLPIKDPAGANLGSNPHDSLHDGMWDELVAIGAELGTLPKGTAASVKARLDNMNTDAVGSNFTTVTSAANFTTTLNSWRWGALGFISVGIERTGVNVGATTAVLGTIDAGGRGTFSSATQPVPMRSRSTSVLGDALCWVDVSTGQISVQWFDTWPSGASVLFGGVVLYGLPT